ncbi:MAG TPA: hypothetical protein VIH05_03515 [Tepidiformaceae bacterium]
MMNEEQSKRLAEAAEAVLQAADALDDAGNAITDRRFESEQERDRLQAAQQMASKIDSAGKRVEDALRRGTIAAAALGRPGAYLRYREATAAARDGRAMGRLAADLDGTANKRAKGEEALVRLDTALAAAAIIIFGED